MDLNFRKCKCMVFSRRDVISRTYVINSSALETVTTFPDFGMLVDMKLSFIDYIGMVIGKARAVLGLYNKTAVHFTRPIFKYASIIIIVIQ